MYKIKIIEDTIFKNAESSKLSSTVQSSQLPSTQTAPILKDRDIVCDRYATLGSHTLLNLCSAIQGRKEWFVYTPHIKIEEMNPTTVVNTEKVLNVRYFTQRDNRNDPYGTCNVTSVAMCLDYYGVRPKVVGKQLEDELFEYIKANRMQVTLHSDLVKVFKAYGVTSIFSTTTAYQDIKRYLQKDCPVVFSGKFTPPGHIVVIVGYNDDEGYYIIHDPWGDWNTGYTKQDGRFVKYSYRDMFNLSYNGSKATWAHLLSR